MSNKTSAKSALPLVLIHWCLALLLIASLLTGWAIAIEQSEYGWVTTLIPWLPQGELFRWHIYLAIAWLAVISGYVSYLWRSKGFGRIILPQAWWITLSRLNDSNQLNIKQTQRQILNQLGYWFFFVLLGCSLLSGLIRYWNPGANPNWSLLHFWSTWGYLVFVVLHLWLHWRLGGNRRLLKIVRPRWRYLGIGSLTLAAAGVALAGYFGGLQQPYSLLVKKINVPGDSPPLIDGYAKDSIWHTAKPLTITTTKGANFVNGRTDVEVRALYDSDYIYFLFIWNDPTRSQKHLPLIKTANGWKVLQTAFLYADENVFYEDKFALLLADDDPQAVLKSIHLGQQPLAEQPQPLAGRGLHYTQAKPGENQADVILDLWHWQSVRSNAHGQADDNYIGPAKQIPPQTPRQFKPGQMGTYNRYTGGYQKDPPTSWPGYGLNWELFTEGRVKPRRLPKELDELPPNSEQVLSPDVSDQGNYWALEWNDTKPYLPEHDNLPIGTVLPAVLIKEPRSGDRGHISAVGQWQNGQWHLEMKRLLDTGSDYDVAISDQTYFWVAAFDHSQARHSRHLRPVKIQLEKP